MDKTIKMVGAILAIVVIASIAILLAGTPPGLESSAKSSGIAATGTIFYFYGEECPHCHNIMPFIENMSQKYPQADLQVLEVWHNETNARLYQQLNLDLGRTQFGVPEIIVGTTVLSGEREIPEKLEGVIQASLKKKA